MIRENPASRDTETLRLLSARALGARKSALVTCPFSFIGPATLAGSMRWSGVEGGAGAEWSGAGAECTLSLYQLTCAKQPPIETTSNSLIIQYRNVSCSTYLLTSVAGFLTK